MIMISDGSCAATNQRGPKGGLVHHKQTLYQFDIFIVEVIDLVQAGAPARFSVSVMPLVVIVPSQTRAHGLVVTAQWTCSDISLGGCPSKVTAH